MPALALTPYSIPLILSAGISAWLAFLVWRRRPGPGVYPLVAILALIMLWNVAYNFEISAAAEASKRLLAGIQYIAITLIPVSWLAFVLEYTGREKWLTQRNLTLLLVEPVIIITIALTNRYHPLLYTSVTLQPEADYTIMITQKGPAFWLHWVYAYVVLLTATVLLLRSLWRTPQIYRGQLVAMLIGAFTPWIANLLYVTELNPLPLFDFTPVAFSLSGLAFAYSMLRYRLMDIVPVARDLVIESMSDAMLLLDNKGRIVDANPAARLALSSKYDTLVSKDTIIGKPARLVLRSYEGLADKYANVAEASDVISLGETLADQRFYDMRISPLHNRSGNLTGRVIVLHDVTDMKRANERIRAQNQTLIKTNEALERAQKAATEANRLKTEFLATMSHELRTPLNAIIGFSDLMMGGVTGELNERQVDYINRILNNSERLLALINDILDVAKIEAGRLEIVEAPFSPSGLVKRIQSQLQSIAEAKKLTFKTYLDADLPERLIGDEHRLEQILTNLVSNAIRFTETGSVEVRLARAGDEAWMIHVKDTGVGIPAHALEYIFDEFRQVDGSTQREHGGTGLGLAVVKKLALLMNGKVSVESEVGRGSVFTIRLPLKQLIDLETKKPLHEE